MPLICPCFGNASSYSVEVAYIFANSHSPRISSSTRWDLQVETYETEEELVATLRVRSCTANAAARWIDWIDSADPPTLTDSRDSAGA